MAADWVPVASGSDREAGVSIGASTSTLWITRLSTGTVRLLPEAAYVHLFVATGEIEVETVGVLGEGDTLRVAESAALRVTGRRPSELLAWAMGAADRGRDLVRGRTRSFPESDRGELS